MNMTLKWDDLQNMIREGLERLKLYIYISTAASFFSKLNHKNSKV